MGAWALKLFTCDYDLELVEELGHEAGLPELEQQVTGTTAVQSKLAAAGRMYDHRILNRGTNAELTQFPTSAEDESKGTHYARYSLYAKLCYDADVVRKHLDDGALARVTADLHGKIKGAHDWFLKDCYGPGYRLCILGACAMNLGARLSDKDKAAMRAVYKDCEFMRDAVLQLEAALEEDTGYVNGAPWDFGGSSLGDVDSALSEDHAFPALGLINVLGPDHGRVAEEMAAWRSTPMKPTASSAEREKTIRNLAFDPFTDEMLARRHPEGYWKNHVCGGCGALSCNGQALLKCARCKVRCYCSKDCQKYHWKQHKYFCQVTGSAS